MENKARNLDIKKGNHKFYMGDDENNALTKITFTESDKEIVIEETLVDDSLKGQGIGKKLVEEVVSQARQDNKKIVPVCSYAKKVLMEEPAYRDILAEEALDNYTGQNEEGQ